MPNQEAHLVLLMLMVSIHQSGFILVKGTTYQSCNRCFTVFLQRVATLHKDCIPTSGALSDAIQ